MKKKGAITDFAAEREAALLTAFSSLVTQRRHVQVHDLCHQLVKMPASRFWVSEERARDMVSCIERRGMAVLDGMRACKQRMFQEIYRRYAALRERSPERSMIDLVAEVVYSPAPEYYMEAANASYLIYRARRMTRIRG